MEPVGINEMPHFSPLGFSASFANPRGEAFTHSVHVACSLDLQHGKKESLLCVGKQKRAVSLAGRK